TWARVACPSGSRRAAAAALPCRAPPVRPTCSRLVTGLLQRPCDLIGREGLDDVAGLHALDPLDPDAALETLQHLADVVLEALEGAEDVLPEQGVAALDADARGADDLPLHHHAAEDRPDLGDREELLDLGATVHRLADLGGEEAGERGLDVVQDV